MLVQPLSLVVLSHSTEQSRPEIATRCVGPTVPAAKTISGARSPSRSITSGVVSTSLYAGAVMPAGGHWHFSFGGRNSDGENTAPWHVSS